MKYNQKLRIFNSCFELKDEDVTNLNLTYEFSEYSVASFKDGKKIKEKIKPKIIFEITGKNKDSKKVWFSFEVTLGLNELKKYSTKPTNISKFVRFDEPALKVGDEPFIFLSFQTANGEINDMFRKLASAYVYKIEENKFIFKIFIPDEHIFTYFEVKF